MNYPELRQELKEFYWYKVDDMSDKFFVDCTKVLDELYKENMTVYDMKSLQYKTITEMFEPVLFFNSPFYYETGTMCAHCDGARDFRGGHRHAGGWTYRKNEHIFIDQNVELWEKKCAQTQELFYLICGPYNDVLQHFVFNYRPVFEFGLKGIYLRALELLDSAKTDEESMFLATLCNGMLSLKKMSEKFAKKAMIRIDEAPSVEAKNNMQRIIDVAKRVPWEKPETFYEALNTYAFLRKTIGALEGIGTNSFGRIDVDLYPFYKKDIENGTLSEREAFELVRKFLITWDLHYDHDMKMVLYSDHELENTYVLGGCDKNGEPIYNELTKMFLVANREEKIIYPKIKCRFSQKSPKEYLDEINKSVINGTSTILYQNDDATIPALLRAGRTSGEANDYIISGCWGVNCNGVEKIEGATYVNMLKAFEYSIHNFTDKMEKVGMIFKPFDNAKSFEEVYSITCENIMTLFEERVRITREGGNIWHKVDPLPIYSSTLQNCLENKTDYTAGGAKYHDEGFKCCGFPNIVDSLLVIKELCFESKKYTLDELLYAVRNNWNGYEDMRIEATRCHGWGDGSQESCELANRFNNDLYKMTQSLDGTYGGKVLLSYLNYTEIRWWGEKTLATPDGRRDGDYFAQGLTPSRLKKIPAVTDVINSMASLDPSVIGNSSVVNIILPSTKTTLDVCESFLRAVASSAVQALQLNCTTKEQLTEAQKNPEKFPDLIVRVTGFSAKFTALSTEWQNEVLSRNFYE